MVDCASALLMLPDDADLLVPGLHVQCVVMIRGSMESPWGNLGSWWHVKRGSRRKERQTKGTFLELHPFSLLSTKEAPFLPLMYINVTSFKQRFFFSFLY